MYVLTFWEAPVNILRLSAFDIADWHSTVIGIQTRTTDWQHPSSQEDLLQVDVP